MDQILIAHLFKRARHLAKQSGLDTNLVLIIGLIGSLILISVIITFLIWLRYLVGVGLITTSVVAGIRWRRGNNAGITWNGEQGKVDDLEIPTWD